MPKIYTDEERKYIKKRLQEEAAYCMQNYGIRRTTVDELVERVKIPKGTFYLFYKTKELLLYEVLMCEHESIENQLFEDVKKLCGRVTPDNLTEVIFRFFKATDHSGVLKLLTTGEIELLYRKLPQATFQEHFIQDSLIVKKIVNELNLPVPENIDTYSAAFRNLFISMIYKRQVNDTNFDEALKLMIKGLAIQLL